MVSFSFILGIPAIIGSSASELIDAVKNESIGDPLPILLGMITAAVVGYFAIRLIQWLVKTDRFRLFSYYTLALGAATVTLGIVEKIQSI